jgi:hypothetical protein
MNPNDIWEKIRAAKRDNPELRRMWWSRKEWALLGLLFNLNEYKMPRKKVLFAGLYHYRRKS